MDMQPINTELTSLIEYDEQLVLSLKSAAPQCVQQIKQHHVIKHMETLNAIASLQPDSLKFTENYRKLVELKNAHQKATEIWSL